MIIIIMKINNLSNVVEKESIFCLGGAGEAKTLVYTRKSIHTVFMVGQ